MRRGGRIGGCSRAPANLQAFRRHRGLVAGGFRTRRRRDRRAHGRQRRRQVDAGQDHGRQLPAVGRPDCCWKARPVHFHKPVDARAAGIEVVYQDLALCNNLTASANVFLAREKMRGFGPFRILDDRAMNERARELFAELKSETLPRREGAHDVRRPAPGRCHRAHASVASQDRADGRADGGDQRAAGRGGARPSPAVARAGHGGGADQPPHARCLRASPTASSCCGAATRLPTSRSGTARRRRSPASSPARSGTPETWRGRTRAMASPSDRRRMKAMTEAPWCGDGSPAQPFWVDRRRRPDLRGDELARARRFRPGTISSTSRATSPTSVSWRSG